MDCFKERLLDGGRAKRRGRSNNKLLGLGKEEEKQHNQGKNVNCFICYILTIWQQESSSSTNFYERIITKRVCKANVNYIKTLYGKCHLILNCDLILNK